MRSRFYHKQNACHVSKSTRGYVLRVGSADIKADYDLKEVVPLIRQGQARCHLSCTDCILKHPVGFYVGGGR
jgi:hypothetical protein